MNGHVKTLFAAAMISMLAMIGCKSAAPATVHIQQDFDFSSIKKVAVLPFENLSQEKSAGDAVRQVVINELLVSGLVDVSVPGDSVAAVTKLGIINPSALTAEQMKSIANTLKVQALVLGSVERFGEVRSGTYNVPEVTVTLMMADISSGAIVWSVTKTAVGDSFTARHFGARADTMSETMIRVVREAVQTLTKYQ
ncbi:MAG: hypothetical protein OHK006_15280 [Thermodesulfovibrionales bacterium]